MNNNPDDFLKSLHLINYKAFNYILLDLKILFLRNEEVVGKVELADYQAFF